MVATNERVGKAIKPTVSELNNWIKQTSSNIHVDETPWLVKGIEESLWVVANSEFCLFTATDTHSGFETLDSGMYNDFS